MKKTVLNIGKELRKTEQKEIFGGNPGPSDPFLYGCTSSYTHCIAGDPSGCPSGEVCQMYVTGGSVKVGKTTITWNEHDWLCSCPS